MITVNGKEFRNLVEQVQKNKDDIANYHNFNESLADWGIRIIGQLDVWSPPQGEFEYGDAYAVGPDGGPFVFYIWTRGTPDYWFDYGSISIVGPQGPEGDRGEPGEDGKSSRWYVGSSAPTSNLREGDMWLRVNNDGSTNGFVYQYQNNAWALATSIKGPQGDPGKDGKDGKQGIQGPQGPQGPAGNPSPIIDIIGELPEGSVISDTYDPSTLPSNSGILMPVGGVNHLFIIINGYWIDSGSWGQGGTRVYVNNEEVTTFNADTKLDKDTSVTEYNQVYVKAANGGQGSINVTKQIVGSAVVQRKDDGGIALPLSPVLPQDAVCKNYVDGAIAQAHSNDHHSMNLAFSKPTGTAKRSFTIPLAFYYDEFMNLSESASINDPGATITLPCEIFYQIGGHWSLSVPWANAQLYKVSSPDAGGTFQFGIALLEAGATLCRIDCFGTADSQTRSLTFTGNIAESTHGAPVELVELILILPPDLTPDI